MHKKKKALDTSNERVSQHPAPHPRLRRGWLGKFRKLAGAEPLLQNWNGATTRFDATEWEW